MKIDGYQFERMVIEVALRMLQERGQSQVDLANAVWPDKSKPDNIWQAVKGEGGKKPRDLRVCELYDIAWFFGYDVEDFVYKIKKELKESIRSTPARTPDLSLHG